MFGISSCAKCGGGAFKLVMQEPQGSNVKMNFVQCSACNAPIGVADFYSTGSQLVSLKKQVDSLASDVSSMKQTLEKMARDLRK